MPAALWPRASLLRRSLFWKILLAFWLTLLLAGVGAGLVVWWHIRKHEHQPLSGGGRAPPCCCTWLNPCWCMATKLRCAVS